MGLPFSYLHLNVCSMHMYAVLAVTFGCIQAFVDKLKPRLLDAGVDDVATRIPDVLALLR